jgi:hypothetical protein
VMCQPAAAPRRPKILRRGAPKVVPRRQRPPPALLHALITESQMIRNISELRSRPSWAWLSRLWITGILRRGSGSPKRVLNGRSLIFLYQLFAKGGEPAHAARSFDTSRESLHDRPGSRQFSARPHHDGLRITGGWEVDRNQDHGSARALANLARNGFGP